MRKSRKNYLGYQVNIVLIGMLIWFVGLALSASVAQAAPPPIEHLHALAFDPQTNTLFIGTHNGIYTSRDEGKSWKKVTLPEKWGSLDIMTFALDPSNSKVLYVGTHSHGVLRSTDGGSTWEQVNSGLGGMDIHAITINPNKPETIHAWAVDKGLYRSKDGGAKWARADDGPPNPDVRALSSVNISTGMGGIFLFAGTADGLYFNPDCL